MKRARLVVLIPVGPFCELNHVRDTVASVEHYVKSSHITILLDDSGKGTATAVKEGSENVIVLEAERPMGKNAGLYLNLSRGMCFACENFDFDIILRLDTDALVIGKNPEDDALEYFEANQDFGIIGSWKKDCNGDRRDFSWARDRLLKEVGWKYLLADPVHRFRGWRFLRKMLKRAKGESYELGEHCMGGAYFLSRACLVRMQKEGLLGREEIALSRLQEDQIFGLLIHSVGFRHGDFATGRYPMGLRWRGLPCAPPELIERKKKITHSTRFFKDLSEDEIREFFRIERAGA